MAGVNEKKLVVVQLSGGNDALNTVIPYNDGNYYDNRPQVHIDPDKALKLDANLAMNPSMTAIKRLWDEGKVAGINGIGYPEPNRSHFRLHARRGQSTSVSGQVLTLDKGHNERAESP